MVILLFRPRLGVTPVGIPPSPNFCGHTPTTTVPPHLPHHGQAWWWWAWWCVRLLHYYQLPPWVTSGAFVRHAVLIILLFWFRRGHFPKRPPPHPTLTFSQITPDCNLVPEQTGKTRQSSFCITPPHPSLNRHQVALVPLLPPYPTLGPQPAHLPLAPTFGYPFPCVLPFTDPALPHLALPQDSTPPHHRLDRTDTPPQHDREKDRQTDPIPMIL